MEATKEEAKAASVAAERASEERERHFAIELTRLREAAAEAERTHSMTFEGLRRELESARQKVREAEGKRREMQQSIATVRFAAEEAMVAEDEVASIKRAIAKREGQLMPLYVQISHEFADLHDRPGRMKAKGVIRDVLSWPRSRAYLAKRLKRRLAEDALRARFRGLSEDAVSSKLRALAGSAYDDDTAFVTWSAGTAARVAVDAAVNEAAVAAVQSEVKALVADLAPSARARATSRSTRTFVARRSFTAPDLRPSA